MRNKSKGQGFSRPQGAGGAIKDSRFFIVAAVFIILCVLFSIFMIRAYLIGPTKEYEQYEISESTVSGERGCIYDRNGELLVGNSVTYDFIFEYGSMPTTRREINAALLSCIDRLQKTGNADRRVEDYFPLEGSYPSFKFADGYNDTDTDIGHHFNRFKIRNEIGDAITAAQVANFFVEKYRLEQYDYTNAQKTELIRIYYDMDRIGFGALQHYTIADGLVADEPEHMALITAVKETRILGANFLKQTERVYYYEGYAEHILGSVGRIYAEEAEKYEALGYSMTDIVGKTGCELAFEEYLRPKNGIEVTKYDSNGKLVGEPYYSVAPKRGNDIYLTIDIKLQMKSEDALKDEVDRLEDSEAGALTALDPQTGEVLAMASYSTYTGQNLALFGLYAPGSTYKIGSALAGLETGAIGADSRYNCTQTCDFGPDCLGLHGSIDVEDAIAYSCNIFFDRLGLDLGMDRITDYTRRLGLGVSTGIELGDAVGVVASKDYAETLENYVWRDFDEASGAIGQSLHLYTPIQLSVYMSSVVNGGTRYGVHLLKSINQGEKVIVARKPEAEDVLKISSGAYSTLMSGMRGVITKNDALARYFSGVDVAVGGKTGTAQTSNETDNALFSGFAPFDKPQIVATCVLEEGEVGNNAAKVVAAIFEEYFNPSENEEETEEVED